MTGVWIWLGLVFAVWFFGGLLGTIARQADERRNAQRSCCCPGHHRCGRG